MAEPDPDPFTRSLFNLIGLGTPALRNRLHVDAPPPKADLLAQPQPLTESWQRLHLYEALNVAFSNAPKPLLLLIDDLQWCDQDSFEWLHSLFRSGAADRFLVLAGRFSGHQSCLAVGYGPWRGMEFGF